MIKSALFKLYKMLNSKEKRLFYVCWFLLFISGIMQVLGIVSIMPFITVVSNRDMIYENDILNWAFNFFSFSSELNFLIFLGSGVVVFALLSNGTIALTRFIQARFITYIAIKIQTNLLRLYLHKPYTFFLKRNTATLAKTLLSETKLVVSGILLPGIEMMNNIIISIMILILLFATDFMLALISIVVLGGLFGSVYYFIRKKLRIIGRQRVQANGRRYKAAQEALSGIKEIKLMGKEHAYLNYFARPVKTMYKLNEKGILIQQIPPILMEVLVMTGIMVLILYLLITMGGITSALPTITLFAFATYRLKPSLQTVFGKWSGIKYQMASLENVMEDMEADEEGNIHFERTENRLRLQHNLKAQNIEFKYPNTENLTLNNITLYISANSSVAFVGPTGSGKTTLVDTLLGLLKFSSGYIEIDGVKVEEDKWRKWQNNIGYIPQHIYLTDDSVAANIAFGISNKSISMEQVIASAKAAHLHDFILELPDGYETTVGERGIRLSGGQRQRMGIARALYHNPDVLVMDEATSALDNITEKAVMEAIQDLSGSKTIIMIAHRLSTVRNCDKIFLMEKGKIVDEGSYSELRERNKYFQELTMDVE